MSTGVIYITLGKKHSEEACISAASLKSKMPNISITLFSDQEVQSGYFDTVVPIKACQSRYEIKKAKILYLNMSPYQYTLYLDSDTYVLDDISELFMLLDRFDIAVAHAPIRQTHAISGVPDVFSEFNAGVILFRKTPQISSFFSDWLALYPQNLNPGLQDQPAFRKSLYHSKLRIATLTPEYNCRFRHVGYLHRAIKILHARHSDLLAVAKALNAETRPRVHIKQKVYIMTDKGIKVIDYSGLGKWKRTIHRVKRSLQERGVWASLGTVLRRIKSMGRLST